MAICKSCGSYMRGSHVERHRRNEETGEVVLYKNVRRIACPKGCAGGTYDFRRAYPEGKERNNPLERFIPKNEIDVTGPLFIFGLAAGYFLFAYGIIMAEVSIAFKALFFFLLTAIAFGFQTWLSLGDGPKKAGVSDRQNGEPKS